VSSPPATKGGDEPPRVRGLGCVFGDGLVTLPYVAETAHLALLPDGTEARVRIAGVGEGGLGRMEGLDARGAPPLQDAEPGLAVTVAVVSDISPSVRFLPGRVDAAEPDGRFTVQLDGRLSEDATASGSPVLANGIVVGMVGPTATSTSVDAFGAAAIREVLVPAFELAGGVSSDLVDPTTGIPLDRDRLGLGTDVTMFATLVADTRTPMPLSIGLFGEWGSGKSTFMALLRHEIARLSASSDPRYHGDIVQIGFNAWHYADANLWASLGDEIFEQLAGPKGETTAERREALREALADRLQRRQELSAATERARAETERLAAQLDQAKAARRSSARDLAGAVVDAPEVQKALKRLGAGDRDGQVQLLASELDRTVEDVSTVRRAAAGVPPWAWIAGIVAALAVAVGVALAWDTLPGIAAGVAAVMALAGAVAKRVRSGARVLREVADGLRTREDDEVAPHMQRLRAAETSERVLQTQLDEVIGQVGELGRELAELAPGSRLYSFVAERAASDAYRGQLGLISTIRKDFEQLIALMKEWREEGGGDEAHRPIDRIVLYIDDLDRCSPEQVVEVLQAVHLLLALDLFVVVVGVDPRWLLHSLRREYRSMLTTRAPGVERDMRWETTPQDYLEKIFNIPYALPKMSPTTFEQLVGSFADVEEHEDQEQRDASPSGGAPAQPAASTPAEQGSEVASLRAGVSEPERRPLTTPELAMLTALAPLVETPRETKRLVNLYRMMRSTRDLSPASRFLGDDATPGEYQAVVILLGLLSGHARLLHDVLGGLRDRPRQEHWADFAADLAPRPDGDGLVNGVVGPIPEADAEEWTRVASGLEDVSALVTIPDLRPFQAWAPRIARFSFLLASYADEPR
jgi:dephospho-CoA kinase